MSRLFARQARAAARVRGGGGRRQFSNKIRTSETCTRRAGHSKYGYKSRGRFPDYIKSSMSLRSKIPRVRARDGGRPCRVVAIGRLSNRDLFTKYFFRRFRAVNGGGGVITGLGRHALVFFNISHG